MILKETLCKNLQTQNNLLSGGRLYRQHARRFSQGFFHGGPHHSKSEYHHQHHGYSHHQYGSHHGFYHQCYSGESSPFGWERLGSISSYSTFTPPSYAHENYTNFFNGTLLFQKLYSTVYSDVPAALLSPPSPSAALDTNGANNGLVIASAAPLVAFSGGLELLTAAAGIPYHHQSLGVLSPNMSDEACKDVFYAYGCGDDAFFVRKNALAVADGVGGWSNVPGGNPALYSRTLLSQIYQSIGQLRIPGKAVEEGMIAAVEKAWRLASPILGSSTLAMAFLSEAEPKSSSCGYELYLYNLGDSGILVFRQGELVYRSKEQCHRFNCPFQLGGKSRDTPKSAAIDKIHTEIGDVAVIGTDGLLDNLSDESILSIVRKHMALTGHLAARLEAHVSEGKAASQLTRSQYLETKIELEKHMKNMTLELARAAQSSFSGSSVSLSVNGSPNTAKELPAAAAKMRFQGSKPDDVSVVAGLVVPCATTMQPSGATFAAKL